MSTSAQILKVTHFPYQEFDERGDVTYWEDHTGYWRKYAYDQYGNQVYYETSDGYWVKSQYDDSGNLVHWEYYDGKIWRKKND